MDTLSRNNGDSSIKSIIGGIALLVMLGLMATALIINNNKRPTEFPDDFTVVIRTYGTGDVKPYVYVNVHDVKDNRGNYVRFYTEDGTKVMHNGTYDVIYIPQESLGKELTKLEEE